MTEHDKRSGYPPAGSDKDATEIMTEITGGLASKTTGKTTGADDAPTQRVTHVPDAPAVVTGGSAPDVATLVADAVPADAPTVVAGGDSSAVATVVAGGAATASGALASIGPGTVLKQRFRLEAKLGSGAMGAVYRAVDQRRVETQHQNPYVAIKLIAGEFSRDPRAFVALQRETDKSQTLAHPNIITVYDFDRDGDLFFMTMESLSGTTLDSVIAKRELKRKAAQGYIGDIASAIAYAHRRNIVHSDLKPQNVFITEQGTLKVLDFGIARAFSESGDAVADSGEVAGLTPAYASCEMFAGKDPHPADDVYAIGLIAYELLAGEHPFGRKRAVDARTQGLKPKRIRSIPGYQWAAISKALAFDRTQRWPNAEAFRRKFSGTGRRVVQLSVAVLILILGFGGYAVFYQPTAGPDIPFDQLPASTQHQIDQDLTNGKAAMGVGDINGGLFYFNKAYVLHPRDRRVMAQLNGLLDKVFAHMAAGDHAPGSVARHLGQVKLLLNYKSLQQNPRLVKKRKRLEAQLKTSG